MPNLLGCCALTLVAGCVDRALAPIETIAGVDLGVDAGPDASSCGAVHTRVTGPVSTVASLDGATTFVPGAAIRLLVSFELSHSCDPPAEVIASLSTDSDGSTVVYLTGEAWETDGVYGPDCGSPVPYTREVTIPAISLSAPRIVVNAAFHTLVLTPVASPSSPACTPTDPGAPCAADCDCNGLDPAMLCLVDTAGARRCGRPCHEDAECRQGATGPTCLAGPSYACGITQICRTAAECPFGEHVENCVCTPAVSPASYSCACDADCTAGTLCSDSYCVQVCTGPHTCGVYGEGEGGTACSQGRCLLPL